MTIRFNNISKNFGATIALNDVSFSIKDQTILGLLGENGAGKSTLMNILGGVLPPSAGSVEIEGVEYHSLNANKAFELGISFIHQELNLVNDLKVYENLFLNRELTKHGLLDKKSMIARSKEVLARMNLDINPEAFIKDIDTSRKQLVEIAKALLFDSKIIIFDEPTTALTDTEIQGLFKLMREFKSQGITCIYISHKMPELFQICDEYVVLRDGKFIAQGLMSDIDERIATELLVGKALDHSAVYLEDNQFEEESFRVENLTCKPYFYDVSFSLKKGEVIAITGLFGDGRSELSEALFGVRHCQEGSIYVNDKHISKVNINNLIHSGVAMVPRDRKERSVIHDMNIGDNLSMANFNFQRKKPFVSAYQERERYQKNVSLYSIKAASAKAPITSLSGGNQQKVMFARWFELDNDVYILDNPTQGIDVGSKSEIYSLIAELSAKGKSIIVFTSEFPEIKKIAHRCIIMYRGRINKIVSNEDLQEVDVMYYSTGANIKESNHDQTQQNN